MGNYSKKDKVLKSAQEAVIARKKKEIKKGKCFDEC